MIWRRRKNERTLLILRIQAQQIWDEAHESNPPDWKTADRARRWLETQRNIKAIKSK